VFFLISKVKKKLEKKARKFLIQLSLYLLASLALKPNHFPLLLSLVEVPPPFVFLLLLFILFCSTILFISASDGGSGAEAGYTTYMRCRMMSSKLDGFMAKNTVIAIGMERYTENLNASREKDLAITVVMLCFFFVVVVCVCL